MSKEECVKAIASSIVRNSRECFEKNSDDQSSYNTCVADFCGKQCGKSTRDCNELCVSHASPLFGALTAVQKKQLAAKDEAKDDTAQLAAKDDTAHMNKAQLQERSKELQGEQQDALAELQEAQQRMVKLNSRIKARAEQEIHNGNKAKGEEEMAKVQQLDSMQGEINSHLANVQAFTTVANRQLHQSGMGLVQKKVSSAPSFLQQNRDSTRKAPEDELAKEMTHDLEMNFNKIAPFGK